MYDYFAKRKSDGTTHRAHNLLRDRTRRSPGRRVAAAHPDVTKVWVDGGYNNATVDHGATLGIDVEVVKRPSSRGFQPLPKRWMVERTFGRLMQHRRLARDYETLPQRSGAMIHWAMANTMSRALTEESTLSWRTETDFHTISA